MRCPKLLYISVSIFITLSLLTYRSSGFNQTWRFVSDLSFSAPLPNQSDVTGRKNIWADLTHEEVLSLEGFLHSGLSGLNLSHEKDTQGGHDYLLIMELLRPNKTDALHFLDKDGSKSAPKRFARVTVKRNSTGEPRVEEYSVGPLPLGLATSIQPHNFPYNSGRSSTTIPTPDVPALLTWMNAVGAEVADIVNGSFGLPVTGFHNDKSPEIEFEASSSEHIFSEGNRTMRWIGFFQKSDASTLLPQGLYFKADTTGSEPKNWRVVCWLYNNLVYPTSQDLRTAWSSPSFKKLPGNLDGVWTTLEPDFNANPNAYSSGSAPTFVQSGESRVRVDRDEAFISWMGFEFNFAFSQVNGISLYDIRLDGERIVYELSLQEAIAHYAGGDPMQSGTAFLDSMFGMGSRLSELIPGFDCPSHAQFFDTSYCRSEKRYSRSNTICVFETPTDYPLQRHSHGKVITSFTNSVLILRTIAVIGNYDYLIDYIFYLDGTFEVKVRASGYIQGAYWLNETQPEYGYRIHESFASSIHDHVLNFKADLDIGGQNNTMSVLTIAEKQTRYPWSAGQTVNTMHMERTHIENENHSSIDWPPNSASMYVVVGPQNDFGERRGYRIMPGTGVGSPAHLTIKNSTNLQQSAEWATSDFFITKQKDTEPRSATPMNAFTPADPLIRFGQFLDGESLVDEDLVIWFNLGNHHVPHTGDLPNTLMTTSASSVMFSPHNYHTRDRARALTAGVRVEMAHGNGEPIVEFFGRMKMMPNITGFKLDAQHDRKLPLEDEGLSV